MLMNINEINPDPDQPRRTFNEEKMEALRASMRADGFRKQYPIIINGGNTIVDGERRWRAAKAVGIKEVPVEKKAHVTPSERLLYQLQSEGAELDVRERNKAWVKLWELSQKFDTKASLSRKLGIKESTYKGVIDDWYIYQEALGKIGEQTSAADVSYETIVEVGKEDKEIIEKAVKEKWSRDKAREIKRAIKEKPMRAKQILSQDYSDPYEGSNQWKTRLEVAKSDIDIQALEDMRVTREQMFHQVDKWDQLTGAVVHLRTAIREFDFKVAPPEIRAKLHQLVSNVLPELSGYKEKLEAFMLENGELEVTNKLEA